MLKTAQVKNFLLTNEIILTKSLFILLRFDYLQVDPDQHKLQQILSKESEKSIRLKFIKKMRTDFYA